MTITPAELNQNLRLERMLWKAYEEAKMDLHVAQRRDGDIAEAENAISRAATEWHTRSVANKADARAALEAAGFDVDNLARALG